MPRIRCCILGATGFIGGQIARAVDARGWNVRGLRRRPNAVGAIGDLDIDWVTGDLSDPASLVTALRGCPLAFHAAGYYPKSTRDLQGALRHGVSGMRNVLQAAAIAGVKRLVYTSSPSTIGSPSEGPLGRLEGTERLANEDDLYIPGSSALPYFEVKWAMEMEAMRATAQGLPVVITLPTVTFGPGDVKPAWGELLLRIAQGRLSGYAEGEINVVDGRDVAAGHIAAAERGEPGHRYILGGHNLSIHEVLTIAAEVAERRPPRFKWPSWLLGTVAGRLGTDRLKILRHWQPLDVSRTREALELSDPIPFEQTCRDALTWFREHDYWEGKSTKRPKEETE